MLSKKLLRLSFDQVVFSLSDYLVDLSFQAEYSKKQLTLGLKLFQNNYLCKFSQLPEKQEFY